MHFAVNYHSLSQWIMANFDPTQLQIRQPFTGNLAQLISLGDSENRDDRADLISSGNEAYLTSHHST